MGWIEDYHDRQFREPYRSTVAFCNWLERIGYVSKDMQFSVLDLGCGKGANIYYMSQKFPNANFVGVDVNPDLVSVGNRFFQEQNIINCRLETGDIYALDEEYAGRFDGIASFQTLMCLPEHRKPLAAMAKLRPKWIALSSLFYDGPVSCTIHVHDHGNDEAPKTGYYNVYSLADVDRFLNGLGYGGFQAVPFEIDVDLPRPNGKGRGTYTEKLADGRRLQISGPLLMPWHFVGACALARAEQTPSSVAV